MQCNIPFYISDWKINRVKMYLLLTCSCIFVNVYFNLLKERIYLILQLSNIVIIYCEQYIQYIFKSSGDSTS